MYEYKWNTVPTMEKDDWHNLHIVKQIEFIIHMGFARGGYLELRWWQVWKHVESLPERDRYCWIIQRFTQYCITSLSRYPYSRIWWGECDGQQYRRHSPYTPWVKGSWSTGIYELLPCCDPLWTTFENNWKYRCVTKSNGAKIRGFILKDLILQKRKPTRSSKPILYEGSSMEKFRASAKSCQWSVG